MQTKLLESQKKTGKNFKMTDDKQILRQQFNLLNKDNQRNELKNKLKCELEHAKQNISRIEKELEMLENKSRRLIKQFVHLLILENPTVYAPWWYGPLATGGCDSIWRTKEQALARLQELDNDPFIEIDLEETVKPRQLANMENAFVEKMAIREMLE